MVQSPAFLGELTELHLARNNLTELPAYPGMSNLKIMDVAGNRISAIGDSVRHLSALEQLDVSECSLCTIDAAIGELTRLQRLIAFKNDVVQLPEELGSCSSLAEVNFFNNKLIRVPASLAKMTALEDVNFGSNKLKTFPAPEDWPACTRVALQWNNLVLLPSMSGAPACRQLLLAGNSFLPALPELFGMRESLEMLDCSGCAIESLGDDVPKMKHLKHLNASKNAIRELPGDLS